MHLQPGQILAEKYRIVRLLGQGGMGAVYEGENTRIKRRVAIKTLHASVSDRSDVLTRFEREAQAAGRIGSEHIVEVLDLGDLPDGSRFMVMEFLEGVTLGERIVKQGRIPPRDVVVILSQLLDGLSAAHQAGIIHRDLKPANVFLMGAKGGRSDFVKILDFGVSKFSVLGGDDMSMTRTGAVVGTPYYMSPEQAKGGRNLDARSDLYSVGVILYEAITGQVPFNAETFNELIFKIALESPPPPEQFVPNLDPAFSALVRRAMAREVNDRFQSAEELKQGLLAWARDFDRRSQVGFSPSAGVMSTQMLPQMPAAPPGGVATHPGATVPLQGMTEAAQALAASRAQPAFAASGPGQAPAGMAGFAPPPAAPHPMAPHPAPAEAPPVAPARGGPPVAALVGGGLALFLVAGLVGFFALRGGSQADGPTGKGAKSAEPAATVVEKAPTAAPTSEPTAAPTSEPTAAPTSEPTTTAEPTATPPPTAAPTGTSAQPRPTAKPTATAAPTAKPTAKPPTTGRPITGDL